MTKFEFVQEAALRILAANPTLGAASIAKQANNIADEVWKLFDPAPSEEKKESDTTSFKDRSIRELINEVDRLDGANIEEIKQMRNGSGYPYRSPQKSGYAVRLTSICRHYNITTIGELLAVGKYEFRKFRSVGVLCVDLVTRALKNLYGIETW